MVIAGLDAGGRQDQNLSVPVMEKIWELPAPVLVESGWCTDASGEKCRGEKNRLFKSRSR